MEVKPTEGDVPHLLITQLRFARAEFVRCLEGVSAEDGVRRLEPMNCISWIVGHLASQENFYWVQMAQGQSIAPGLYRLVGYGQPPSTPPLEEMWTVWGEITSAADRYLGTLTPELLQTHLQWQGKPRVESVGTMLLRNIYQKSSIYTATATAGQSSSSVCIPFSAPTVMNPPTFCVM